MHPVIWYSAPFNLPPWRAAGSRSWLPIGRSSRSSAVPSTTAASHRSEEHTSELQSRQYLVCRLLLEKKKEDESRHLYYEYTNRICDYRSIGQCIHNYQILVSHSNLILSYMH